MKKLFMGIVVGAVLFGSGVAVAGTNTKNDVVLNEDKYQEFFKKEGNGGKNYLYTRTEQPAPKPGKCNVYTGASETAIAVVCNIKAG